MDQNTDIPNEKAADDQTGTLTIRVNTGYGIYPLEGALVTVSLEDKENASVVSQTYTNSSGTTPQIMLKVRGDNEQGEYLPGGQRFTIEVSKDGYRTLIYHGVQLYPLIDTLLTVNLAPLPDRPGIRMTPYDSEIIL